MKNNKTKTKNKKVKVATVAAVGAGVIALAAASYYFFGPEGKKHRNRLKGWMIKMKGEIIEKMEASKELTEKIYHQIVDSVAAATSKAGKISEAEVRMFAEGLKRQWKRIAGQTKKKVARKVGLKVKRKVSQPNRAAKKK